MGELLLSYRYVFVLFGSIFEGDATLLSASFLAHRHLISLAAVIATATVASTAWNELVFYFARKGGRGFLERRLARHPQYEQVQRWVLRRSVVLLMFSRYIFGFRLAIPVACGATGMRPSMFSVVNALGAIIWAAPVALVGFFLGNFLETLWHGIRQWEWHIAGAFLIVITGLLAWKDPELCRLSMAVKHIGRFTVLSTHRLRHLLGNLPALGQDEETTASV